MNNRAIIADDEAPLRRALKFHLQKLWPELEICGEAVNGPEVLALVEKQKPHVAFLDIRMPGLSGLEAARRIAGQCHIVFVTAHDEYAVNAFENEAMDYLLKPVTTERLQKTIRRLKNRLDQTALPAAELMRKMDVVMSAVNRDRSAAYLKWIKSQSSGGLRLIPVDEIAYFKASDKYTAVFTVKSEALIKTSIKELATQLDPQYFWQIHRGTIVNVGFIHRVSRSVTGRYVIRLSGLSQTLTVSRAYSHLFKQM